MTEIILYTVSDMAANDCAIKGCLGGEGQPCINDKRCRLYVPLCLLAPWFTLFVDSQQTAQRLPPGIRKALVLLHILASRDLSRAILPCRCCCYVCVPVNERAGTNEIIRGEQSDGLIFLTEMT